MEFTLSGKTAEFTLSGKTALVTGAGQGAGLGIACGVAQQGARVWVNDIDPGALPMRLALFS